MKLRRAELCSADAHARTAAERGLGSTGALPAFQHDLALGAMALQQRMGTAQVGRVDAPEVLAQRGLQHAGIDRSATRFSRSCWRCMSAVRYSGRVNIDSQCSDNALRLSAITSTWPGSSIRPNCPAAPAAPRSARSAGRNGSGWPRASLMPSRARPSASGEAVVDHMVGAIAYTQSWVSGRGGADHGQPGELPRQLHQDRADTTGSADHQQGLAFAPSSECAGGRTAAPRR